MKHRLLLLPLGLAIALTSCSQYATVARKKVEYRPSGAASGDLVAAEQGIADALKNERRAPLAAIGQYLAAAQTASRQLARNPNDTNARDAYNFAVARVIDTIGSARLDPWSKALALPAENGGYLVSHRPDARKGWNPALYEFTPADEFDVGGKYVKERTVKAGVGAPIVATGRGMNQDAQRDFTLPRIFYGVTAVIRFEGKRAIIAFEDPLATENITLGGRSMPLAADFTTPLAVMLASTDPKKFELSRLLNPEKYAQTARIARLQPYDPEKTVVLVIHGLMDTPATWTPMLNELRGDKDIRSRYQFWFYSYPSGYPYPYSASILRHELDAVEKRFALNKKMVVIGHSMGGCISRLLITDTGEHVWRDLFGKSPAETTLLPESRKLLTDAIIFEHRPEVGRVIFISAPLRGSDIASNWLGRIGSRLVRAPSTLLKVGSDAFRLVTFQAHDLRLKTVPNSVDTLAPNNRFVQAINRVPVTPGIPHHVICGDRGKGGNHDKTKPVCSDGVVPYWSSHMETAQSEMVVPSGHNAHQHPKAIAEVKRILKQYGR